MLECLNGVGVRAGGQSRFTSSEVVRPYGEVEYREFGEKGADGRVQWTYT